MTAAKPLTVKQLRARIAWRMAQAERTADELDELRARLVEATALADLDALDDDRQTTTERTST